MKKSLLLAAFLFATPVAAQVVQWDQIADNATPLANAKADCVNRAVNLGFVSDDALLESFYRNCMFHHGYTRHPRPGVATDYFPPAPRKM